MIERITPLLECEPRPSNVETALIIMHSTAKGELDHTRADHAIEILRERGLSYHYIISKSGAIFECVPPILRARHAGSSYGPREEALGLSNVQKEDFTFEEGTSVNDYSIGISFVNLDDGQDPFTPVQTEAATWLVLRLRQEFKTLEHLASHAAIAPGRKVDPLGYDMAGLAKATGLKLWSRTGPV